MRVWQALRSWLSGAPHALGLGIFFAQVALGIVIFAIFQEFVPNNLGASDGFGGYLLALYGGARFLSETPAGAISDRIERKYALLLGFALMVPALALMGAIQVEWAYLGFAALLGISTAFIWPATYAIGADLYPPTERGKVVGFLNVGQLLGFGLGALVGALLVETFPDSLFIIAIVAVAAALATGQVGVPAYRRELGAAHEHRPPLRSVLSKRLVFLSALILAATVVISSLVPAIRPYGDNVLDISFAQLTVFLIPAVVAGGILYVPSGHLSDRIGRTLPLLLGQFLIIAGALTAAATTGPERLDDGPRARGVPGHADRVVGGAERAGPGDRARPGRGRRRCLRRAHGVPDGGDGGGVHRGPDDRLRAGLRVRASDPPGG